MGDKRKTTSEIPSPPPPLHLSPLLVCMEEHVHNILAIKEYQVVYRKKRLTYMYMKQ